MADPKKQILDVIESLQGEVDYLEKNEKSPRAIEKKKGMIKKLNESLRKWEDIYSDSEWKNYQLAARFRNMRLDLEKIYYTLQFYSVHVPGALHPEIIIKMPVPHVVQHVDSVLQYWEDFEETRKWIDQKIQETQQRKNEMTHGRTG